MSRTYKAMGINLKAMPLGEADRILTILTPDLGLLRVVAPGSRKPQSRLGGRSDLFVINEWLVAKGKHLDKVVQAETARTFPKLCHDLGRLTASQYLAEVVLLMALNDGSQAALYHLFVEHLERLEASPAHGLLAALTHGLYHLLALAGVAPEVHRCCLSQVDIVPNLMDPQWTVGFSPEAGGLVQWAALGQPPLSQRPRSRGAPRPDRGGVLPPLREASGSYGHRLSDPQAVNAMDVALLQQLSKPEILATLPVLPGPSDPATVSAHQDRWARIERLLRHYAQDYFERPIRSAALIDVCFTTV